MSMMNAAYNPVSQNVSQVVYVQSVPTADTMRYYTSEAVNPAPMSHMTFLYPAASAGMQSISTPPQQQQQQFVQHFSQPQPQQQRLPSPTAQSYYICQNRPIELNNNGKVVYLVPSTPVNNTVGNNSNNGSQVSFLIQSNNSSSSNIPMNQPYCTQEMYTTTQMAPQQQQVTYVTMPAPMAATPPQPMMDPATKLALLRSPEVCRHYLNGRCNRRKCRFLHPDLHPSVEPAMMTYVAAEPVTPALSRTSHATANVAPYSNSLSSSMNSFSMAPAPVTWTAQTA